MDDNALNLRKLENHYKFLTDKRTIRITTAILSEKSYPDVLVAQPGQDWNGDNDTGPLDRPGQVRVLLDKRVGDAVTFAFTTGAVRSA
jgi:hypothetical protein